MHKMFHTLIHIESTLSSDECLHEDVDDPYSSLLFMNAPSESTCMPNISYVNCLLDLQLGSTNSHLAFIYCGSNLLIIFVFLEWRVPLFVKLKSQTSMSTSSNFKRSVWQRVVFDPFFFSFYWHVSQPPSLACTIHWMGVYLLHTNAL
jgi:hypothetical protein